MATSRESRLNTRVTRAPSRARARRRRATQGELFARTWGGARKSSGRKRLAQREQVEHRNRASFRGARPVHVTLRLVAGLPSMRERAAYRVLVRALGAASERFGQRVVHWSVLGNHLHLVVEVGDREPLSRGMQGLGVRMARALNRAWARVGRVFADRYHAHVLRFPREVRNALVYVLHNARKHHIPVAGADPFSSGPWFDGWIGAAGHGSDGLERPAWLRAARTWLLSRGWMRLGRVDIHGRTSDS